MNKFFYYKTKLMCVYMGEMAEQVFYNPGFYYNFVRLRHLMSAADDVGMLISKG